MIMIDFACHHACVPAMLDLCKGRSCFAGRISDRALKPYPCQKQIQSLLLLSLLFRSISFSLVIPQRKELRYCTGQIHSSENMLLKWPKQRWFIIIDHHWSLLIIIDQLSLDVNLVGSASSESGSYKPNRYSCGGFSASPARGPECCEHWGQVARRATGCYRCERSQT